MHELVTKMTVGSRSNSPDLDWSQIRETVRLLNLAVAQIEESMRAGDESVEALTDSFTSMAGIIQVINGAIDNLPESVNSEITNLLGGKCHSLHDKVQQAIIAFQFYDRLVQKLSHISSSMGALGNLISDNSRLYNPAEWCELQEKIRARYTMESERVMFDALMDGASINEALAISKNYEKDMKDGQGDIDLF